MGQNAAVMQVASTAWHVLDKGTAMQAVQDKHALCKLQLCNFALALKQS